MYLKRLLVLQLILILQYSHLLAPKVLNLRLRTHPFTLGLHPMPLLAPAALQSILPHQPMPHPAPMVLQLTLAHHPILLLAPMVLQCVMLPLAPMVPQLTLAHHPMPLLAPMALQHVITHHPMPPLAPMVLQLILTHHHWHLLSPRMVTPKIHPLILCLLHLLALQVHLSTLTLHPIVYPLILTPDQPVVPALVLMPLQMYPTTISMALMTTQWWTPLNPLQILFIKPPIRHTAMIKPLTLIQTSMSLVLLHEV